MKLQGFSVFFCLIAVPIILVLTYYIQAQITTISLQMSYDTKLLDATHDAMVALEINTANEDLSSVSDSLRSIVKASTNIFINTLSTNLNMSNATRSSLEPYIPAILVSLYDGYYIYSPTRVPKICTDEDGVAVYVGDPGVTGTSAGYTYTPGSANISASEDDYGMLLYKLKNSDTYVADINNANIDYETDYVLKSYIPYAARYKNGTDLDVQINYTLDNYINVYGTIKGVYYTKSGYYTNHEVTACNAGGVNLLTYGDEEITEFCENVANSIEITIKKGTESFTLSTVNDTNGQSRKAIEYYLRSYIFSKWVDENLKTIEEGFIQERLSEENRETYNHTLIGNNDSEILASEIMATFTGSTVKIFDPAQDPESNDSAFANHKHNVMRNSIQYNLNLAMSAYNQMNISSFAFNMPVVDNDTWDRITSKISILTFMQGFKCGLKTYNNYACVSSTNNEFIVLPEEIYYVGPNGNDKTKMKSGLNDEVTIYHRINCPKFTDMISGWSDDEIRANIESFISKEIKYDKIYDKVDGNYKYDHKNAACYTCIIAGNYLSEQDSQEAYYHKFEFDKLPMEAKKAYLIALGKERTEIYKTNQIIDNIGSYYQTHISAADKVGLNNEVELILSDSTKKLSDIDSIEITISNVCRDDSGEPPLDPNDPMLAVRKRYPHPVAYAKFYINSHQIINTDEADGLFRIINQTGKQTIRLWFGSNAALATDATGAGGSRIKIEIDSSIIAPDPKIKYTIDTIKVNYK